MKYTTYTSTTCGMARATGIGSVEFAGNPSPQAAFAPRVLAIAGRIFCQRIWPFGIRSLEESETNERGLEDYQ